MDTVLDPHTTLKRQAGLIMIAASGMTASIAVLIHSWQPNPHLIDKIAPPAILISCIVLFIRLYRKPESLNRFSAIAPLVMALPMIVPNWFFTYNAFRSASTTLIDNYPPLTAPLFLWTTVTLIFLKPQHLLKVVSLGWLVGAAPVLSYLLLHSRELFAPRGLDLFISLGPAMLVQIAMVLFYSRLQVLLDRLYAERLQYYSKVIEKQEIRHQAMEQAFTQFHNGPLQSLAVLLREVQQERVPSAGVFQRLTQLNAEFRDVGRNLLKSTEIEEPTATLATPSKAIAEATLRLGSGTRLDLNLPLHHLLYDVYATTLKRDLPHFQTIRVKVRSFTPLETLSLTCDRKRDICLWLEEALCNVGKHARGVTRIQVTGTLQEGRYTLKVQDNGVGLQPGQERQGTTQSNRLAQRLGGTFRRESLPNGGVLCELAWPLDLRKSPL